MGSASATRAKAGIITRGLAEMTRLGVAAGAHQLTFAGLAGVGDLIATCMSPLSRNRRAGELMGSGMSWTDAAALLNGVAEGVTRCAGRWTWPRSMASSCRSPSRWRPSFTTAARRWRPSLS